MAAQALLLHAAATQFLALPGHVGSAWDEVSASRLVRFPALPSAPDMRLSPHPALQSVERVVIAVLLSTVSGAGLVLCHSQFVDPPNQQSAAALNLPDPDDDAATGTAMGTLEQTSRATTPGPKTGTRMTVHLRSKIIIQAGLLFQASSAL